MFVERKKMAEFSQLNLHSQVSFESQAICYNATFNEEVDRCGQFFSINPKEDEVIETNEDMNNVDEVIDDESIDSESDIEENSDQYFGANDLSRKQISSATFNYLGNIGKHMLEFLIYI